MWRGWDITGAWELLVCWLLASFGKSRYDHGLGVHSDNLLPEFTDAVRRQIGGCFRHDKSAIPGRRPWCSLVCYEQDSVGMDHLDGRFSFHGGPFCYLYLHSDKGGSRYGQLERERHLAMEVTFKQPINHDASKIAHLLWIHNSRGYFAKQYIPH